MARKTRLTAHALIAPAVDGLLERTRAAADRVIEDRDDPEAVHDFRVGLRRLRSILRAARGIYPKARLKPVEAAFKSFGDATGALRDSEVLAETLQAALLDSKGRRAATKWIERCRDREGALREGAITLIAGPTLDDSFAQLRKCLGRGPKSDMPVPDFAADRFRAARADVHKLLPVERGETERLHRLRLRFKRMRYTCEMLGQFLTVVDVSGKSKRQRAQAHEAALRYASMARYAARMQKQLGLLHDADQAILATADAPLTQLERVAIVSALTDLRERLVDRSLERLDKMPKQVTGIRHPVRSDPGRSHPGRSHPGHSDPGHSSPGHSSPGHSSPGHSSLGHGSPGVDPGVGLAEPERATDETPRSVES